MNPTLNGLPGHIPCLPGSVVGEKVGVFQGVPRGLFEGGAGIPKPDSPGNFLVSHNDQNIATPVDEILTPVHHNPSITSRSNMRIYYQNVRGLRTKIDRFSLAVADSDYDVIVLTETWLDDGILSTQLFDGSYAVFRNDRNSRNSRKSRGGGVLIAVSDQPFADSTSVSDTLEQLWVIIKLHGQFISIGVIYLPPDRSNDLDLIQLNANSIQSIMSALNYGDFALQFGDYNHPELRWIPSEDGGFKVDATSRLTASGCALYDTFSFHGLTQVNPIRNANDRILDLVLVNDETLPNCNVCEALDTFVHTDEAHPALDVAVTMSLPLRFQNIMNVQHDFRRADYNLLNDALLSVDWQFLSSELSIDDLVG